MANIIPSILENNLQEIHNKLDQLSGLVELGQIDLGDGEFIINKLITKDELAKLKSPIYLEAHLMVNDPLEWSSYLNPKIFKRAYFHIEALPEPEELILHLKDLGIEPGLAINLKTPLDNFFEYVEMVDSILFMSVEPGRQGQKFNPEVLEKINDFVNQFPDHLIAIDGGINQSNIIDVVKVGVDNICVGSEIFGNQNIKENLNKLNNLIN